MTLGLSFVMADHAGPAFRRPECKHVPAMHVIAKGFSMQAGRFAQLIRHSIAGRAADYAFGKSAPVHWTNAVV